MAETFSFDVLPDGRPVLSVGESCIQTAARKAHRELTAALLEERAAGVKLESALEILERFLSTTDFAALRTEHPELAGGTRCLVRLDRRDDGSVCWEVVAPQPP